VAEPSRQLALIADIHGNLEALDAVLADIDRRAPDASLACAGDIVGYGPDPEACIARLRTRDVQCVMGNHEEMLLGKRDFSRCVYAGVKSAIWARKRLGSEARAFLEALPSSREVAPGVVVCHGDLESADTYISDPERAAAALTQLGQQWPDAGMLVCAHTHHPAVYTVTSGFELVAPPDVRDVDGGEPCIVNPGAVGQSRDTRAVARYAMLDLETRQLSFHELEYDHQTTIRKLRRAGLVPQVVLKRPEGAVAQRIEWYKLRWARYWAERDNARLHQTR
jgi:predicted phosphodiesterase